MKELNYYEILEVPNNASLQQIQYAFRKKIKITHPDVNNKENADIETRKLIQVYETLKDSNSRKKYDLSIGIRKTASDNNKFYEERYESSSSDEWSNQFEKWYNTFLNNNLQYFDFDINSIYSIIEMINIFKKEARSNKNKTSEEKTKIKKR